MINFELLDEDETEQKQKRDEEQRQKQQQLQQQLLNYISQNDVANVRRMVEEEGAKVNHVDKFYNSFGRVSLGGGQDGVEHSFLKKTGLITMWKMI